MIEPLVEGAVTVTVNDCVPLFAATGPGTVHVSNAPDALGSVPHAAPVTAVATTPAGSWSCTTRFVPVAV